MSPVIPTSVTVWIDPACPWAWQTARWLVDLESRGVVTLEWRAFSLEIVNATEPNVPFEQLCPRFGEALSALALARIEAGAEGFRALYLALGERLHDQKERMSSDLLREAVDAAGRPGLAGRAVADPALAEVVMSEHAEARALDVFGVPTLRIGQAKVLYGPILSVAPDGNAALEMWSHVRWLADRPELFEIKRWPRDLRPGQAPPSPA